MLPAAAFLFAGALVALLFGYRRSGLQGTIAGLMSFNLGLVILFPQYRVFAGFVSLFLFLIDRHALPFKPLQSAFIFAGASLFLFLPFVFAPALNKLPFTLMVIAAFLVSIGLYRKKIFSFAHSLEIADLALFGLTMAFYPFLWPIYTVLESSRAILLIVRKTGNFDRPQTQAEDFPQDKKEPEAPAPIELPLGELETLEDEVKKLLTAAEEWNQIPAYLQTLARSLICPDSGVCSGQNSKLIETFVASPLKDYDKNLGELIDQSKLISNGMINFVSILDNARKNASETFHILTNIQKRLTELDAVVRVLTRIGEQAGILAMNAAIESANTSVLSGGFEGVSADLRNLSELIHQNTGNIQNRLNEIRKNIMEGERQSTQVAEFFNQFGFHADDLFQRVLQLIQDSEDQKERLNESLELLTQFEEHQRSISEQMDAIKLQKTEYINRYQNYIELLNRRTKALSALEPALQRIGALLNPGKTAQSN